MLNLLSFLVIFVFIISPLSGITMIVRDVIRSRQKTHDLKVILNGRTYFQKLSEGKDISASYAALENWLENAIRSLETPLAKTNLRLLMQATYIGHNEVVRTRLFKDKKHRVAVLRQIDELFSCYQDGLLKSSFYQMGLLYGLFLCDTKIIARDYDINQLNLKIAVQPLRVTANLLDENIYKADIQLGDALKEIANSGKPEEVGLALMLLHWAKYKIKEIDSIAQQRKWQLVEPTKVLSNQVSRLADACVAEDITQVTEIIGERF